MTKEELEKESEEWIKEHSGLIGSYEFVKYDYDSMQKAYLAGAEPREKQIQALGERCLQLQKDKGRLTDELTRAKEIIRDFISVAIDYIDKEDKNYSYIVEAEQFLNSEVEK